MTKSKNREKLNELIAKVVSGFAKKSATIDNDVDSNMMIMALTILDLLKKNDMSAYECAMEQLGERENPSKTEDIKNVH